MIRGKIKAFSVLLALIVSMIAISGAASAFNAANVGIDWAKVDGDYVVPGALTDFALELDRDNEFPVRVSVVSTEDIENAEIEVVISGYDHSDRVSKVSDVFNMKANTSHTEELDLKLPARMDVDQYTMWVYLRDRTTQVFTEYELSIDTVGHSIVIRDVDLDPATEIEAGRSMRAIVNIKNYGQTDEDDVKVEFSVPELGLKALPDYLDIEADESETSEELYLRLPLCTEAGQYTGQVKVTYHDGDYVETQTVYINVVESPSGCGVDETPVETVVEEEDNEKPVVEEKKEKTIITVGAQSQEMKLGEGGAIYPITFTNSGSDSKTYVLSVSGVDEWATVKISPLQTVTLGEGESKSVYVYVSAKENALAAEHMFTVDVKDASGNVVKQIPMTANVLEGEQAPKETSGLKKALEIGLIVLVVILIVIALIVVFTKKKDEDEDEAEDEISGQTYY